MVRLRRGPLALLRIRPRSVLSACLLLRLSGRDAQDQTRQARQRQERGDDEMQSEEAEGMALGQRLAASDAVTQGIEAAIHRKTQHSALSSIQGDSIRSLLHICPRCFTNCRNRNDYG